VAGTLPHTPTPSKLFKC